MGVGTIVFYTLKLQLASTMMWPGICSFIIILIGTSLNCDWKYGKGRLATLFLLILAFLPFTIGDGICHDLHRSIVKGTKGKGSQEPTGVF